MVNLEKKTGQWIMLSILAMIWGTSFILMKFGLRSFSNMQVAAFRIFISFLLLIPFLFNRIKKVRKNHLKSLLIVGFIGNAIPAFLFTKAQTEVSSSIAGVLNSLTPLFALLIGLLVFKMKFNLSSLFGVLIGLTGAVLLIVFTGNFSIDLKNMYPLLIVLATVMYAFNVNEVKQNLKDLDAITIVAVAFAIVGPFAGAYLLFSDFSDTAYNSAAIASFSCIFLLALFSSVVATILFNNLIKHTTALFASSVTYLIPIVAISWGLLDGENLSFSQFLSIIIIMFGVYLVNRKPSKI
jgi:drug/metabolite transporter (DMT)-like permease